MKNYIFLSVLIFLAFAGSVVLHGGKANATGSNAVACTMEAKLCPNGTFVSRTGPNCEFAACPTTIPTPNSNSTVPTVSPIRQPYSYPSCAILRVLRIGSTGDEVICLQKWLGLGADGKFGPKTQAAVLNFQLQAQLKNDGIVGPQSVSALKLNTNMQAR